MTRVDALSASHPPEPRKRPGVARERKVEDATSTLGSERSFSSLRHLSAIQRGGVGMGWGWGEGKIRVSEMYRKFASHPGLRRYVG